MNILNEEDQENIEQVMQGWDEAIPEFVHDLAERVAHEIERYYTAEYHTPQGCEVTIKGSMQIGVEFLQDELRVETTDWTLDTRLEVDLAEKCRHHPDWDTLDRSWAVPKVTCERCGKVTSLHTDKLEWKEP